MTGVTQAQSLYDPTKFKPMTADKRAAALGDVITVLVYENSTAAQTADSSTGRKTGIDLGLKNPSTEKNATLDVGDDFRGGGRIQRSGKLLAQLTVTVKSVLPNGDLLISGDQSIDVNDEKQRISLEGRVRPADIADNNTVISTRIADAKISYIGDGVLAEKQKPGWLSRIFSFLGL
ncbi:MAG: flagellar basal body L-ring protein FlgH [Burkholderiales bacterium]|nr:flagellar basal body L-ring protein FlgH [Burkholderiales bacterium]